VFPIRASFPGTVVQVLKQEGEYTEAGADKQLVRIDETDTLFVEGSVPEIELHKLKLGQEVLVKASSMPGKSFKGAIRQIFLAAKEQKDWDRTNVEFPLRIEVLEKDPMLRPGMSALVDVIAAKKAKVLVLRQEFVRKQGDEFSVTLESGDTREVEVGPAERRELRDRLGPEGGRPGAPGGFPGAGLGRVGHVARQGRRRAARALS
jgi:hypothetical protein